jgi:hypothetical protein
MAYITTEGWFCAARHRRPRAARSRWLPVGVRGPPVVVAEVRLRESHQHPGVVRRPQDLGETEVRPRLATVVVGVDEVDPEAFQPLEALAGGRIVGERGAHLRVVQRHHREMDPAAVQEEIPALDPELAEPEPDSPVGVERHRPRHSCRVHLESMWCAAGCGNPRDRAASRRSSTRSDRPRDWSG